MPPTTEHAGPRGLRRLLDAVLSIGSELDLETVLQRIIEAAVDLVGARYGALGVLNEAGTGLAEFITVGIDDDGRQAIGNLPKGLGLLGTLIRDADPLRIPDVREHPDRGGFPPNHPPMTSFLGVPIRVRQEVFGNLYLTDKTGGEVFTDVDEELALGLAAAAGIAIANARLFDQLRQREAALGAMHELATALISGTSPDESLRLVARYARELVRADLATIALPGDDDGTLVLQVADGPGSPDGGSADSLTGALAGQRFSRAGSISGDVLETGEAAVIDDASLDHRVAQPQVRAGDIGPALFVALLADGRPFGTLSVARRQGVAPFVASDLDMVRAFAAQASVALERDRARQRVHRVTLLEDQERIARDLHDSVIQRLFAIGLSLEASRRLVSEPAVLERLTTAVDDLDTTVRHIRTVIFDVEAPRSAPAEGLRSKVIVVTREAARVLGFEPQVAFAGPVDTTVAGDVGDDLVATLREALSNAARHAHANHLDIDVAVSPRAVTLRVTDDGVGFDTPHADTAGHGLRNMRIRAERRGGTLDIAPGPRGGTVVEWRVPLR